MLEDELQAKSVKRKVCDSRNQRWVRGRLLTFKRLTKRAPKSTRTKVQSAMSQTKTTEKSYDVFHIDKLWSRTAIHATEERDPVDFECNTTEQEFRFQSRE